MFQTVFLFLNFHEAAKELAMARHVTATTVVDRTFPGVGYVWEFHRKTEKKTYFLINFRISLPTPGRQIRTAEV